MQIPRLDDGIFMDFKQRNISDTGEEIRSELVSVVSVDKIGPSYSEESGPEQKIK